MAAAVWWQLHKGLILVSILCVAFIISTIVLGVELNRAWSTTSDDSGATTTESPGTQPWEINYRVPDDIEVISYDVLLQPFFQTGTFKGTVYITLNMGEPRDWLAVHIKDMTVTYQNVFDTDTKQNFTLMEAFPYPENEFYVIRFNQALPAKKITAYLEFDGNMTDSIVGFYRSSYTENGVNKYIATSKFEPVDARQAFPCFDEPALKATFAVTLIIPATGGYSALSNMEIDSTSNGPGVDEKTVKFKVSEKMSTYLACFIISDFQTLGTVNARNLPVTVYSTPGQTKNTELARDAAREVVQYYMDYFGVNYPLPKLDLVAIPDFVSGAMENWGLITFRETALLYEDGVNSAAAQKRVALVVAHEISHQWFGNLVTMAWWDDLWLNEGFASFMEYKGVQQMTVGKDWNIVDQGVFDDVQSVLTSDSELSSHPIIQTVQHPNQINEIFDSISYDKGQAVLRMLENFMGEGDFQKGLKNYLTKYQFGNAATLDLWTQLNLESPTVNVIDVMDTWTRQMGYPVLHVELKGSDLVLTQARFLRDPNAVFNATESPYGYKWDIPIQYWTSEDPSSSTLTWLKRDQPSVSIPWPSSAVPFVKINSKQVGFYRVSYPDDQWNIFAQLLQDDPSIQVIPELDRSNLLDDIFNLADAGLAEYPTALKLVDFLKVEEDYLPWASGSTLLKRLTNRLSSSKNLDKVQNFVQDLVVGKYGVGTGQYNWDVSPSDSHLRRMTRVKLLDLACYVGLQACIDDAGKLFEQWVADGTFPLPADLRPLIYRYGMAAVVKEADWQIVWDRYLKESNAQEKINLLDCVAQVQVLSIVERLLDLAKDESLVRSQDYFVLLGNVASNRNARDLLWDWYRANWEYLVNRFTLYHRSLGTSIVTVTESFATQDRLDEIQAFFGKYPDAGAGAAARKRSLEKVENNIKWLARNENAITGALPRVRSAIRH